MNSLPPSNPGGSGGNTPPDGNSNSNNINSIKQDIRYDSNNDRSFRKALQSASNPQLLLSNKKKNTRRKHRNSHLGCGTCKKRRIKCDENLPSCLNCLKGKLHCAYLNLDPTARNALRMAQYNQNLRNDKYSDDERDEINGADSSNNSPPSQITDSASESNQPSSINRNTSPNTHPQIHQPIPPVQIPPPILGMSNPLSASVMNTSMPAPPPSVSALHSHPAAPLPHHHHHPHPHAGMTSSSSPGIASAPPPPPGTTTNNRYNLLVPTGPTSTSTSMNSSPSNQSGSSDKQNFSPNMPNSNSITPAPHSSSPHNESSNPSIINAPGSHNQDNANATIVPSPYGPLVQFQTYPVGNMMYSNMGVPVQVQSVPQVVQVPLPMLQNQLQMQGLQTLPQSIQQLNLHAAPVPIALNQQQVLAAQAQVQAQTQQMHGTPPSMPPYDHQNQYSKAQPHAPAQVNMPPIQLTLPTPQVQLQPLSQSPNSISAPAPLGKAKTSGNNSSDNSANSTPSQIQLPTINQQSISGKQLGSSDPSNHAAATANSSSNTNLNSRNVSANNSPPTLPAIKRDNSVSSKVSTNSSTNSPPYAYDNPSKSHHDSKSGDYNVQSPTSSHSGVSDNGSNLDSRSGSTTNLHMVKNMKLSSESPPNQKFLDVKLPPIKVENEAHDKVPSISKLLS